MATIKYKVVECDQCHHKFKLKPKIMQIKIINNKVISKSVERHYFLCPKCKHMYIVMYQDQAYKENLKEMEVIRKKASELRTGDQRYVRLFNEHEKLHQKNLDISKYYKKIYGS